MHFFSGRNTRAFVTGLNSLIKLSSSFSFGLSLKFGLMLLIILILNLNVENKLTT